MRRLLPLTLLALVGCGERPVFEPGEGCTLSSDCVTPFVCRLERCRAECATIRDCPLGSLCVRDADGIGACRLSDEAECELDGECTAPLVCRAGACTNECVEDGDCTAGSVCAMDPASGELGCFDPSDTECSRASDCPDDYVCKADGRCRPICREDRDCRDGSVCTVVGELAMCEPAP